MNQKKSTILIVDEEPQMQKMLAMLLDEAQFRLISSDCGKQAVRLCVATRPDLILLDSDLPDMEGAAVLAAFRQWSQAPIIILSTRAEDADVAAALNGGANDYVAKPFSAEVLLARMHAALRTAAVRETGEPELQNGPLRMDLVRHEVFLGDTRLPLTPKEYDLLRHFMVNRGKMLTRKEILKQVWGPAHSDDIPYLRVYIGQIREKIEKNPNLPPFITTAPGVGYRMEVHSHEGK